MSTVSVVQGALRGRRSKTRSGGPLVSFLGVPYARPPVGPLRFKAPQTAESWTGIRDALKEGAVCPHYDMLTKKLVGDEDCLFLNVYTPKLPALREESLRPVMVWVHGGGFASGSGSSTVYGPDYLVDAGVVLVTFNYRLGPLGFLSLGNADVPGNAGLKDQVAALRWVKQNIASFGGDPNNVTIFGESAGAASVHFHMLSPMSKGLFQRAIAQSGTALNWWALARTPVLRAFRLGEAMGCKTDSPRELEEFFRQAAPQSMLDCVDKARSKEEIRKGVWYTFLPCVEPNVPGQEAFLVEDPETLVLDGKFHRVPFMVGVNSHEGIMVLKDLVDNPDLLSAIDSDFERMVPESLLSIKKKDLQRSRELSEKIKTFYFGCRPLSQDTILEYINLQTDRAFALGIHRSVKLHSTASPNTPLYYYQFCFSGVLNFFKNFVLKKSELPGACHADDIGYLFHLSALDINLPPTSPEMATLRRMVKMWTNFAKTGNPTPQTDEDVAVTWPTYSASNPRHLKIDTDLSVGEEVEQERMAFWSQLYRAKL